jgi:hypothetical protein
VTVSFARIEEVARYLRDRGAEVMFASAHLQMRAPIDDYPAAVNIKFRSSGVVRVSVGLPVIVAPELRETFALYLIELNRRRLGAAFVLTEGIAFFSQVPLDHEKRVAAEPLDRTIALCLEATRGSLAALRKIRATGLAPA